MKIIKSLFLLILIIIPSCTLFTSDEKDCICTLEFRMINVVVVDDQNFPVIGLTVTVKDESGKEYDVSKDQIPFPGNYTVMSDNFVNELSTVPKKFFFKGKSDSLEVNAEFLINTDECNCHVYKVSGPDTVITR